MQSKRRKIESKSEDKGIDVAEAVSFDYINPDITFFDGENIPFEDNTFDAIICTEVLEHVYNHQKLVELIEAL